MLRLFCSHPHAVSREATLPYLSSHSHSFWLEQGGKGKIVKKGEGALKSKLV